MDDVRSCHHDFSRGFVGKFDRISTSRSNPCKLVVDRTPNLEYRKRDTIGNKEQIYVSVSQCGFEERLSICTWRGVFLRLHSILTLLPSSTQAPLITISLSVQHSVPAFAVFQVLQGSFIEVGPAIDVNLIASLVPDPINAPLLLIGQ